VVEVLVLCQSVVEEVLDQEDQQQAAAEAQADNPSSFDEDALVIRQGRHSSSGQKHLS